MHGGSNGRDSLAFERTDLDARHWDGCKALPKQRSFAERWNGTPGVSPVIEEGRSPYRGDGARDLKEGTKRQRSGVLEVPDGDDPRLRRMEDGKPVGRTFCREQRHSLGVLMPVGRVLPFAPLAESPGRASGLEAGGQRSEPTFADRPDRADSRQCTSHPSDGAA